MSDGQRYWTFDDNLTVPRVIDGKEVARQRLRFDPLPQSRIVSAQRLTFTNHGKIVVIGSRGQIYVDWNHGRYDDMVVRPGGSAKSLAEAFCRLGIITRKEFDRYAALCDIASKQRGLERAAYEMEHAAKTLGIPLTAKQKTALKKAA